MQITTKPKNSTKAVLDCTKYKNNTKRGSQPQQNQKEVNSSHGRNLDMMEWPESVAEATRSCYIEFLFVK